MTAAELRQRVAEESADPRERDLWAEERRGVVLLAGLGEWDAAALRAPRSRWPGSGSTAARRELLLHAAEECSVRG